MLSSRKIHISDLPEELLERIAASIIIGDSVGARDIFAFAEVSRRWRHIAISFARLVADGVPDLTDRSWGEADKAIGIDELHPASAQSKLLLEVAGSDMGYSDKHFFCEVLGNLLQHPPPLPRQVNSHTLDNYDCHLLQSTDLMVAEIIGHEVTLIDWREYPPRLLTVQLTKSPQQRESRRSDDFRVDVLRKPDSTEAIAVLIQTVQELVCVPLGKGAGSKTPVCLALDKCFSDCNAPYPNQWVPAETDEAHSDTLRWTRIAQRTQSQYYLELLIMREKTDCWQPTYSGMINIDPFPIGSDPCKIQAYVAQNHVHLVAWACAGMMSAPDSFLLMPDDVGWLGFASISQDEITFNVSHISQVKGIQTLILGGRRRCAYSDTARRLDNFLYVSQDLRHALSMTSENAIEVHSRRSAECAFDSEPSQSIATGSSGFVQTVGILEDFVVYTETSNQKIDIGIFSYRSLGEKAQMWIFEDILHLLVVQDRPSLPKVWISDTVIVAIQGMMPVAVLSNASHHWVRSDGTERIAAALGWSGSVATEIRVADDWIKTDQLTLLIISGLDLVAIALCRRGRPPSIVDARAATIPGYRLSTRGNDDPQNADVDVKRKVHLWLNSLHRPGDDAMILLEGDMSVLVRTEDACFRVVPRTRRHRPACHDSSISVFLQYAWPKASEEPEQQEVLELEGEPLMILRSSDDRAAPIHSSGTRTALCGAASAKRPGMKLSHVTISKNLRRVENQPHRELIVAAERQLEHRRHISGLHHQEGRGWTWLEDGSAIWTGDVFRFLALAQAKVPDPPITV